MEYSSSNSKKMV